MFAKKLPKILCKENCVVRQVRGSFLWDRIEFFETQMGGNVGFDLKENETRQGCKFCTTCDFEKPSRVVNDSNP